MGLAPRDEDIMSLCPATGWVARYKDDTTGESWNDPIIGWGVMRCGVVVPMDCDHNGETGVVSRQTHEHFLDIVHESSIPRV